MFPDVSTIHEAEVLAFPLDVGVILEVGKFLMPGLIKKQPHVVCVLLGRVRLLQ